ncbi:MAG: amidohydrolase family protein [Treponema sp.]|jgi:dihydroorotase|nr:amidohydrolase family protein [Treponema sp.]
MLLLDNFRIVDEVSDFFGSLVIENGMIKEVLDRRAKLLNGASYIDGGGLVLMPAFVDLHAHFREPGALEKESLASGSLAAAAGGFGTVVCMANTSPVTDTVEKAAALKRRGDAVGLIDLYPALSLSRAMDGKELSQITQKDAARYTRLFSEDGKDIKDDDLFLAAFKAARRAGKGSGIPVSCHCDLDGEDHATERALRLGKKAAAHVHLAHVSTARAVSMIRRAKQEGGSVSCEATPHHLSLTGSDAHMLGAETFGKVAPPLRSEADRQALAAAVADGTVDAIATDHAPHTQDDKARGAPGFSGLETAFAVCYTTLVKPAADGISLSKLSSLLGGAPARILGFGGAGPQGRGRIARRYRADLCVVDPNVRWTVNTSLFKSNGKNSPFEGRALYGKVVMTLHRGRVVFQE